jgi:hypothetical protein
VVRDLRDGLLAIGKAKPRRGVPYAPEDTRRIVFDKFGDSYYISEIWVPDRDGFVVGGTKEGTQSASDDYSEQIARFVLAHCLHDDELNLFERTENT